MENIKDRINGSSLRYNNGKVKFNLIPASIRQELFRNREYFPFQQVPISGLIALANHYDMAQNVIAKYPSDEFNGHVNLGNWMKGQRISDMFLSSANRHLYSYVSGEIHDSDLGSHHIIPVAWNLVAVYHQLNNPELYAQFDDRIWSHFNSSEFTVSDINNNFTTTQLVDYLCELLPYIESNKVDLQELSHLIIIGIGYCMWIFHVDKYNSYGTEKLSDIDMTFDDTKKERKDYGTANTSD